MRIIIAMASAVDEVEQEFDKLGGRALDKYIRDHMFHLSQVKPNDMPAYVKDPVTRARIEIIADEIRTSHELDNTYDFHKFLLTEYNISLMQSSRLERLGII